MLLSEFRDWLKTQVMCPKWFCGKIDANEEFCIGLYNTKGPTPRLSVGGLLNTKYTTKAISILVHWGKNSNEAEKKAKEVFNCMFGQKAIVANKRIIKFDMRTSEPVNVGTDVNGIYEYVIETVIYYER